MWVDVQQNTDEWMTLRVGRIGGSSIGKIMANYGKAFGPPANDLATQIALEKLRGINYESSYSNLHMERGHEQEPIARKLYEDTMFCDVTNGGYFIVDDDIGVSPDGLVYDDGVIEIKSVIPTVFYSTISRNAPDPKHRWQLAFNLLCSEREWIDFVEFCSGFPDGKRLFTYRFFCDDFLDEFRMIYKRVKEFRALVQEKITVINRIENR